MSDLSGSRLGVLIAVMTIIAAMSACSSSAPREGADQPVQFRTQIEADSTSGDRSRGLELRVLTVDDSGDRVPQALARFDQDQDVLYGVMDERVHQRWGDWGLRWVVVPIDELDQIIASQDLTKAVQVRWMGEFANWRPIIRTGQLESRPVRIGDQGSGVQRILRGRPRLLGRAWTVPEVSESGTNIKLHLDLGVQLANPPKRDPLGSIKPPTALDEGALVDELRMTLSLDSSHALVLVGEDPAVRWFAAQESGDDASAGSAEVRVSTGSSLGPGIDGLRTLGQHMLSTPGTGIVSPGVRYVAPKKVLLVLIPKAEGRYRLLGPTSASSGNHTGGAP